MALALDMNPNLPTPSFSFLPGLVPHLPTGFGRPFHVPLGVSSLPRISSPPLPWLRGEHPCLLASLLPRSALLLPTSPPAAALIPPSPDNLPFGSSCQTPFSPELQHENPLTTLPSNPQFFPPQHHSQHHRYPHWRHSALTSSASMLH